VSVLVTAVWLGSTGRDWSGPAPQRDAQEGQPRKAAKDKPAAKSGAGPRLSPFPGKLADALALCRDRNVPLLAFAILADEPQNEETRVQVLPSPELAQAAQWSVVLVANNGTHKQKRIEETTPIGVRARDVCEAFGTPNCAEHQLHWDELYQAYSQDGALYCPQVMVIKPDGALVQRLSPGDVPKIAEIVAALDAARKALGPGITDAEWIKLRETLQLARALEEQGDFAGGWKAWGAGLAILPVGVHAAECKSGQTSCARGIVQQRDEALADVQADRIEAGYAKLAALAIACVDTPFAKELEAKVKQLETDAATKDRVARHKREQAAEALWNEAQTLFASKDDKSAERQVRALLRKFRDTAAGERAALRWPDWAREESAKQ
jgi:hypothetical protein